MNRCAALVTAAREVLLGGLRVSLDLFKVMVPIIIAVKTLKELGLIAYLAWPLAPVMALVGLPPEMGLVWATAMLNNIYSGIVVLLSLADTAPLTQAQTTVLAAMILVAHNLPVELTIARKSGPRLGFQLLVRVLGALLLGLILHLTYDGLGLLREPATLLFQAPAGGPEPLWRWALGEARNLASIFCIITGLIGLMRLLQALRLLDLCNAALRPVLRLMGIGPRAATIAVVGLVLGLAYGGGLIIHEARTGQVEGRDVFAALTLMGLCHSLIEDTLLMSLVGGHVSGILWGRLLFSLVVTALLTRGVGRLSGQTARRFLWTPAT
jgi:spore maturation protein SpmB